MGTFTCDGLEVSVQNQLTILKEGTCRKFVQQVEHVTFSGDYATCRTCEIGSQQAALLSAKIYSKHCDESYSCSMFFRFY